MNINIHSSFLRAEGVTPSKYYVMYHYHLSLETTFSESPLKTVSQDNTPKGEGAQSTTGSSTNSAQSTGLEPGVCPCQPFSHCRTSGCSCNLYVFP